MRQNQESHRLEAIAERFGIPVIGRHAAFGATIGSAEVFVKMIPLPATLRDHGLVGLIQMTAPQSCGADDRNTDY